MIHKHTKPPVKLTDLQKYIIDANHKFKTTKQKLDYVNMRVTGKPITKTIFYRILKKLDTNPKTQHYTNKGIFLMRQVELVDELEKIEKEIENLPFDTTKLNRKKAVELDLKFFKIWRMIQEFYLTPHKVL